MIKTFYGFNNIKEVSNFEKNVKILPFNDNDFLIFKKLFYDNIKVHKPHDYVRLLDNNNIEIKFVTVRKNTKSYETNYNSKTYYITNCFFSKLEDDYYYINLIEKEIERTTINNVKDSNINENSKKYLIDGDSGLYFFIKKLLEKRLKNLKKLKL